MRSFSAEIRVVVQELKTGKGKGNQLLIFLRHYFFTILPLIIVCAVYHLYKGNIALGVLLFFTAGFVQNALGVFMHEGSHFFFHGNRKTNDMLADFLFCFSIVNTVDGYRQEHLQHHKFSSEPNDPYHDIYVYKSKADFRKKFFGDIFLVTAVTKFLTRYLKPKNQAQAEGNAPKSSMAYTLGGLFVVHSLLFLFFFWLTGSIFGYFIFWIIPLMSIPSAINRIRTFVEHYSQGGAEANRSVVPGFLEYYLIAPYGYSYHFIHHHTASIPYYNLKLTHERLEQQGVVLNEDEACKGYLRTFFRLFKTLPN